MADALCEGPPHDASAGLWLCSGVVLGVSHLASVGGPRGGGLQNGGFRAVELPGPSCARWLVLRVVLCGWLLSLRPWWCLHQVALRAACLSYLWGGV